LLRTLVARFRSSQVPISVQYKTCWVVSPSSIFSLQNPLVAAPVLPPDENNGRTVFCSPYGGSAVIYPKIFDEIPFRLWSPCPRDDFSLFLQDCFPPLHVCNFDSDFFPLAFFPFDRCFFLPSGILICRLDSSGAGRQSPKSLLHLLGFPSSFSAAPPSGFDFWRLDP